MASEMFASRPTYNEMSRAAMAISTVKPKASSSDAAGAASDAAPPDRKEFFGRWNKLMSKVQKHKAAYEGLKEQLDAASKLLETMQEEIKWVLPLWPMLPHSSSPLATTAAAQSWLHHLAIMQARPCACASHKLHAARMPACVRPCYPAGRSL